MNKKRFMVVSGFLGAGKTTTMLALTEHINNSGKRAAIIANDLGASNIIDAEYSGRQNVEVATVAGVCICYAEELLIERIYRLNREPKDIVMSDIPGCGLGALEHVYGMLDEKYKDEILLAPFVVITDPERLRMIMPEKADINLPEDMKFLLEAQLKEADCIVLNKTDLLTDEEVNLYMNCLKQVRPDVPVFAISAKEKTGLEPLVDYVLTAESNMNVMTDVGYYEQAFIDAEEKLSWFNRSVYITTKDGNTFDGNQFADDLIDEIRMGLIANKKNVPHLKTFTVGQEGDYGKCSLIGVDYDIIHDSQLKEADVSKMKLVVNARAVCESDLLIDIMDDAFDAVKEQYGVKIKTFFSECFGMMDEGYKE